MSIDRREFLKTLGVAGAGLTGVSALGKTKPEPDAEEFYAILHDITLCEGCQECEIACTVEDRTASPRSDAENVGHICSLPRPLL